MHDFGSACCVFFLFCYAGAFGVSCGLPWYNKFEILYKPAKFECSADTQGAASLEVPHRIKLLANFVNTLIAKMVY